MSRSSKPAASNVKNTPSKSTPSQWRDRLAPEDYEELKNTFEVFDEDNSGTIDAAEISKVLEELGVDRRNPFIMKLILSLKDKNRSISFDEFVDLIASQVGETKSKDGLRRVFAIYDKDENGVIDFEEFKQIAKELKDGINDDELLEMMHSAHVNNKTSSNEGFTFEEFYTIVARFNAK
jgi:Ca2+-binding EF-hand superfamily protein